MASRLPSPFLFPAEFAYRLRRRRRASVHSPSPLADPTPTQNEKGGGRLLKAFQNRQKNLCFLPLVSSCMKGSEGKSDCVGQTEQQGRNTDGKEEVVGNSPTEPGFTCGGGRHYPVAQRSGNGQGVGLGKGERKKASSPCSSSSFRKRLLLRPPPRPEEEVGKGGRKRAAAVQKRKTTKKGGHKREKEKRKKKGSSSFLLLPAPDIRRGGGRGKEASFLHSFFRKGRGNGSLALIPLQWEKEFPPAVVLARSGGRVSSSHCPLSGIPTGKRSKMPRRERERGKRRKGEGNGCIPRASDVERVRGGIANECGMEKETEIGQRRKSILVLRGRFRSAGSAMTGGGHRVKGESAAEEMRTAEVPHTITLGGGRKWLSGRIRTGGERGGKSVTGGGQKKGLFRLSTPFYEDHLQTGKKEGLCVCSCVLLHRLRKVLGTQKRGRGKRRRQRHKGDDGTKKGFLLLPSPSSSPV